MLRCRRLRVHDRPLRSDRIAPDVDSRAIAPYRRLAARRIAEYIRTPAFAVFRRGRRSRLSILSCSVSFANVLSDVFAIRVDLAKLVASQPPIFARSLPSASCVRLELRRPIHTAPPPPPAARAEAARSVWPPGCRRWPRPRSRPARSPSTRYSPGESPSIASPPGWHGTATAARRGSTRWPLARLCTGAS